MAGNDAALMARVATGDAGAFARLVERHLNAQVNHASRVLGNQAEAEDAVQDAFLKVWVNAALYDPEKAAFGTWLYRIVTNQCLDRRRKRVLLPLDAAGEMVDPQPTPDAAAAAASSARQVHAALARLPARQRAAISLCYFDQLSNREAAAILGVGIKGLESLLGRGRAGLRLCLGPLREGL